MTARPLIVFALTPGGLATARRIAAGLGGEVRAPARLSGPGEGAAESGALPAATGFDRVGPALREAFVEGAALVCVMAAGVVVRTLAPVLRGKLDDPPVLVVDERGEFVVPLLSGHVGGGNALARRIASVLGGRAVITTSSDVQGLLGPDLLAGSLDALVEPHAALLPVAAALAEGAQVDLWYDPETVGPGGAAFLEGLSGYRARRLPAESDTGAGPAPAASRPAAAVVVVSDSAQAEIPGPPPTRASVRLVPRFVAAGVGCTRGTSREDLVSAVRSAFAEAGLRPEALRTVASARVKEDEQGLHEAARELGVPLVFADDVQIAGEIAAHGLEESEWVRSNVGVGAVAEPAALWAAGPGAVLVRGKRARDGVTVALARGDGGAVAAAREEGWTE